jgi:hypothetical protein
MASTANDSPTSAVPRTIGEIGLGLSEAIVHRALEAGQEAARLTRPAHPRNYAGLTATAEATAVLREGLEPFGWTHFYRDGINGALSPDQMVMLMFVPGDRMTGDAERNPRSKRRGPRGLRLVESNQLELFPIARKEVGQQMVTWYVLNRHDRRDAVIHVEVSLPQSCDTDNRVCIWAQRFVLNPLTLPPSDPSRPPIELDSEQGPAFDVPVEPIDGAFGPGPGRE